MFDEQPPTSSRKLFDWQLVLFIILALVGLIVAARGLSALISFSNQGYSSEENVLVASNSASLTSTLGFIYVDIAGAVREPGIYQLEVGSRLAGVVNKAGGFTLGADLKYLSQDLNLAQKLKDGDKIYILSQEERDYEQSAAEFCQQLAKSSSQGSGDSAGLISINNATSSNLQSLEGIGEIRAEEISAGRPYQSLNELVEREILTASLFGKIKDQLKL